MYQIWNFENNKWDKVAGFWKSLKIKIAEFWKSFQILTEPNSKNIIGKNPVFSEQLAQE